VRDPVSLPVLAEVQPQLSDEPVKDFVIVQSLRRCLLVI
jgi:hypothetical protein